MPKDMSPPVKALIDDKAILSWYHLPYLLGAILASFLLVLAIQYGSGYYNYISILFLMISVSLSVLLVPALFLAQVPSTAKKKSRSFSTGTIILFTTIMLILELGLGLQDVYIHYNQIPLFPPFAKGMGWVVVFLVVTYLLEVPDFSGYRIFTTLTRHRFALMILLSVILKIVTVFASYINKIDVGIMMQESSAYLLSGSNPYTSETAGYGGFNYLPLHLLLPLPFYIIFGDTRFGSIVWELIGISVIYKLAKVELFTFPKLIRLVELVILIFVYQPRSLFVIEQAWGEPLVVGAAAVSLYFFYYKPAGPIADILFAAMLVIKQYLVFMCLPLFILYNFNWKRYTMVALAVVLIILPFIIWNPVEFFNRNVLHFFRLPIQTNSLGLTAYFWEQGILIPRWISPVAAGIVALGFGSLLKRFGILGYLHTVILTLLCLFIFGQQAFANYYYLLSFFQVMAFIFFIVHYYAHSNKSQANYA